MNRLRACALTLQLGVALAAVSFAGGCSFKKQYPAKQSFIVEARRTGEARPSSGASVLRVRNLRIATAFEGKGFVYRIGDLRFESDFYREFLVTPAALFTAMTRQWLEASGLFRFVLEPGSKADATYSLEGNVRTLYGDYRESASAKAVLAIDFLLVAEQSVSPEIVFHRTYRQEVALENRDPETLAGGWSRALAQILNELEQDLAARLK